MAENYSFQFHTMPELLQARQHPADEFDAALMESDRSNQITNIATKLNTLIKIGIPTTVAVGFLGWLSLGQPGLPETPTASASEPVPPLSVTGDCDPNYVAGQNKSNVRFRITNPSNNPIDPEMAGTITKVTTVEKRVVVINQTASGQAYPQEISLVGQAISVIPQEMQTPEMASSMILEPGVEYTFSIEDSRKIKLAESVAKAEENCRPYDSSDVS